MINFSIKAAYGTHAGAATVIAALRVTAGVTLLAASASVLLLPKHKKCHGGPLLPYSKYLLTKSFWLNLFPACIEVCWNFWKTLTMCKVWARSCTFERSGEKNIFFLLLLKHFGDWSVLTWFLFFQDLEYKDKPIQFRGWQRNREKFLPSSWLQRGGPEMGGSPC